MSTTLEQLTNTIESIINTSETPSEDIIQVMIVERWDNRFDGRSVVYMDWQDEEHFKRWLKIEFARRRSPRLKTMIEDIQEMFPGMQMNDILNGVYRYY